MRNAVFPEMIFLSAELTTNTKDENNKATASLKRYLKDNDRTFGEYLGCYKGSLETSFGVLVSTDEDKQFLLDAAKVFGQESILFIDKSRQGMLQFTSGQREKIGQLKLIPQKTALELDNYTQCKKTGNYFTFKG